MEETEPLSKRIRRLRQAKDLSIKAVADFLAVPPSTYKEWEYGRAIQGEPYSRLAECFGVSLGELLTGVSKEGKLLELSLSLRVLRDQVETIEKVLLSLI